LIKTRSIYEDKIFDEFLSSPQRLLRIRYEFFGPPLF